MDGFTPNTAQITETNAGVGGQTLSIPTTAGGTALAGLSGLTAFGYAAFQNLDSTNYVTVGIVVAATYYPVMKLFPGEFAILRLVPAVSYYALANTAAVELFYRVWEN